MELLGIYPEQGYVLIILAATILEHYMWMTSVVNYARRRLDVLYPNCYAPPGHKNEREFNCVQRGHMNSLETLPGFLAQLLVSGMKYPVTAAALGAIYLVFRAVYFKGYCTGDPKNRLRYHCTIIMVLCHISMTGMILRWATELLLGA